MMFEKKEKNRRFMNEWTNENIRKKENVWKEPKYINIYIYI